MKNHNFSSLLRSIMDRNGLTQRELARRAEIDHVSLCRMLKPYYKFKPGKTIERITKAVGCTAQERLELYRIAGLMPEEMILAFCSDPVTADNFARLAACYFMREKVEQAGAEL